MPASSLDSPRAIAIQKHCRCSRRPAGGRPGERIGSRPARPDPDFLVLIATPLTRALRRPIEFTQYRSLAYGRLLRESKIMPSVGSRGDAYDCESLSCRLTA
jgi:hypothetical protein